MDRVWVCNCYAFRRILQAPCQRGACRGAAVQCAGSAQICQIGALIAWPHRIAPKCGIAEGWVEIGAQMCCERFARLSLMTLDELTAQIKAVLAGNPGEDLQKNLRATLSAGLSRMDVVSKQEFDVQREMLNVLRAQVDELTAKVEALEKKDRA